MYMYDSIFGELLGAERALMVAETPRAQQRLLRLLDFECQTFEQTLARRAARMLVWNEFGLLWV